MHGEGKAFQVQFPLNGFSLSVNRCQSPINDEFGVSVATTEDILSFGNTSCVLNNDIQENMESKFTIFRLIKAIFPLGYIRLPF